MNPSDKRAALATLMRRAGRAEGLRISVTGSSMRPTLLDGDLVDIEASGAVRQGSIAAFIGPDDAIVVHRLVVRIGDRHFFMGDANDRPDGVVGADRIIGAVTRAWRSGDQVVLDDDKTTRRRARRDVASALSRTAIRKMIPGGTR